MAILLHPTTNRRFALTARSLIGRSPGCTVPIPKNVVSGEHASLRWTGDAWWVRDLGSRNGSWVDGKSLTAGQEIRVVQGTKLCFGSEDDAWVLEDSGPPGAVAVCMDRPAFAHADGGVLMIPDAEAPEVAFYGTVDGSWLPDDGSEQPIRDGVTIPVSGERWRIHLPSQVDPTIDARPRPIWLRFKVSRDEEYVEINVEDGDKQTLLRPRSFNYLLLTLARHRLNDSDLPATSRGWVEQDDLATSLRIEPRTINVQLYRARQALGQVRVDLATSLVERRNRTGQLRFGLDTVLVEQI